MSKKKRKEQKSMNDKLNNVIDNVYVLLYLFVEYHALYGENLRLYYKDW